MAKRQSSKDLMVGDFSPLTSPFATKIPRNADIASPVALPEKKPHVSRKRKRSVSPDRKDEEKEMEKDWKGLVVIHRDFNCDSSSSGGSSPLAMTTIGSSTMESLTSKYSELELNRRGARFCGTIDSTPPMPPHLQATIDAYFEAQRQEGTSEPKAESPEESDSESVESNGGWDEDDSNDEDNWRNEYPDDEDDHHKGDGDDDGDSDY